MPRALPDVSTRVLTLDTGRRKIDIPVDGSGHIRRNRAVDDMTIVRAADDKAAGIGFKGHASVFNQRTWIGSKRWGFWEQIEPGAYSKTIHEKVVENNDITFNRDHDNRLLLARTSNGTCRLSEDETGLFVDADMGDYSYARDVETALDRRDLTGMSFAFSAVTWEWSIAEDDEDLLTLRELELYDVAVVGMPAYAGTDASFRGDLLACARAQGFDESMIRSLATRLAEPDDELISALRALSDPTADRSTREPDESTRTEPPAAAPPVPSTGDDAAARQRRTAHLQAATTLVKEKMQ